MIFKRKPAYLMEIDAQVSYPLEKFRADPDFAGVPEGQLKVLMLDSLVSQVMEVAGEELQRHGQTPKRKIRAAGHSWETGFELLTNQLGEDHVTFSVAFEGYQDGALAATDGWHERVKTFGGIAEVGRASLRGTDGTHAQVFSEEVVQLAASLDEETAAKIDELMDPDR